MISKYLLLLMDGVLVIFKCKLTNAIHLVPLAMAHKQNNAGFAIQLKERNNNNVFVISAIM